MENALEHFITTIARPHLEEVLKNIVPSIEFKKAFEQIEAFQNSDPLTNFEIAYLAFTLLRTNLLYGRYIYEIHIYDKKWYINDFIKIGEIDVSSIFGWIESTKGALGKEAKKYLGKINTAEIENLISSSLKNFERCFIKAFEDYQESEESEGYDYIIYTGELYGGKHILYGGAKL
ncbi:MAG: hypothetical protein FWE02_05985 [Defluviitaleaceae bacterium]|nr:hypothetical protein [Defluviitaleaceae bacterium]